MMVVSGRCLQIALLLGLVQLALGQAVHCQTQTFTASATGPISVAISFEVRLSLHLCMPAMQLAPSASKRKCCCCCRGCVATLATQGQWLMAAVGGGRGPLLWAAAGPGLLLLVERRHR